MQRGGIQSGTENTILTFSLKVIRAGYAGAIGVLIDNNVAEAEDGMRFWQLTNGSSKSIPALSLSRAHGTDLRQRINQASSERPLSANFNPAETLYIHIYDYSSGTSMASPVVAGAVAFAALNFPDESMVERRNRILNNAENLPALNGVVLTNGLLNLKNIVDTDGDDLPDWWELEHFSSLVTSETTDSDNDGYSNRQEFVAKTDPNQAIDKPQFENQIEISDFAMSGSQQLSFSFMAYPQLNYQIESSSDLEAAWENEASYSGDGTPLRVEIDAPDPASQSRSFYRLSVSE